VANFLLDQSQFPPAHLLQEQLFYGPSLHLAIESPPAPYPQLLEKLWCLLAVQYVMQLSSPMLVQGQRNHLPYPCQTQQEKAEHQKSISLHLEHLAFQNEGHCHSETASWLSRLVSSTHSISAQLQHQCLVHPQRETQTLDPQSALSVPTAQTLAHFLLQSLTTSQCSLAFQDPEASKVDQWGNCLPQVAEMMMEETLGMGLIHLVPFVFPLALQRKAEQDY